MPSRVAITVTISNRLGLHARPAMEFVDTASRYTCSVTVRRSDQSEIVDGKSIMDIMMLAATRGTDLEVVCDGADAEAAAQALKALVDRGFDEE
jgi:phosphocarrier protein HPr